MVVDVNKNRCLRCGGCVSVCPVDALKLTEHGIECSDACINCGRCVDFCPVMALSIKEKTNEGQK